MSIDTVSETDTNTGTDPTVQPPSGEGRKQPDLYLTPNTKAEGALFPIPQEERSENGPVCRGNLTIGGRTYRIAAFKQVAKESEAPYFQLSIEDGRDGVRYQGRAFKRTEEKRYTTTPDLSGFITVLPLYDGIKYDQQVWDDAARLQVTMFNERARGTGQAYYSIHVFPLEVAADELPL